MEKIDQIRILEEDYRLAGFLKALANPVRLSIIRKLVEKSSCPHECHPCSCGQDCEGKNCRCGCKCGELVDMLPMSQSTVSQHIKELKNAGLVLIEGRKGDYVLNHKVLQEGLDFLLAVTGFGLTSAPHRKECECRNHCTPTKG